MMNDHHWKGRALLPDAFARWMGSALLFLLYASIALGQAPSFSWATNDGGPSGAYGRSVAVDGAGNAYMAGTFYGAVATFGAISLSGFADKYSSFVVKIDPNGGVAWARNTLGNPSESLAYGVAVDNTGNVLIVGETGQPNAFIAKYDAAGDLLWTRQSSGFFAQGTAIALAPDGSAFITGLFAAGTTVSFGTNTLTSISGGRDIFLVKYDSAGNAIWAERAGGLTFNYGLCITVDPQGSVLLGGSFTGPANFGNIGLTNGGSLEYFLAKCDSQGNFQWANRIAGSAASESFIGSSLGVVTDAQRNSYLAGAFSSSPPAGFVLKCDPSGSTVWMRSLAAASASITADGLGNVYMGGSFSGSLTLDGKTLSSAGSADVFVYKLNNSGTAIWAKQAGFVFDDYCTGLAVDPAGNVLLVGYFYDTTRFETNTIIGNGYNAFVAKLGNNTVPLYPIIQTQPQSQSVSPGATATFGLVASGAPPLRFQWRFNGTNIALGTNALLAITNALLANAGSYDVVVSNAAGATNSAVVTLTIVPGTPNFADNFAGRGIMIGFTNYVTGNNSLYTLEPGEPAHADRKGTHSAWLTWTAPDNGSSVMDTIGSSFDTVLAVYTGAGVSNLALVVANDDAQPGTVQSRVAFSAVAGVAYQIAVDGYAAADSGNIAFHLSFSNSAPIISLQPQSRSAVAGSNTTFSVSALGIPPLNYQWRFNDSNIAGATGDSYAINNVQPPNQGGYSVIVANGFGSVTSTVATLTVLLPAAIAAQPQSQTVTASGAATFAVSAAGTPPLSYQWRFNGADIGGAFTASFTVSNAQPAQAGSYVVVVSNPYGSVTSLVAALTVNFSLTTATNGNGSVSRAPNLATYSPNSSVNLTATPGTGAFFVNWSGDASGTNNPLPVTMTTNKIITANFAATSLTLATQGSGTIAKSPDRAFYSVGEQVTLTAMPGRWHAFNHWLDGPATNPRVITIGPSNSYTAIFTPTQALETLTFGGVTRTAPVGMPSVFVDGVFVLAGSATNFDSARVEIQSTFPNATILFTLDGTTPGFASTYYEGPFAVRHDATVRALALNSAFTQSVESDPVAIHILPSHTLSVQTAGGGTITRTPDAARYMTGSSVTVTATPDAGWSFVQWLGDAGGTNPSATLTLTRDRCVEAVFGTTLNTAAIGNGTVVVYPATDVYPYGTPARLTALPQPGNYFAFWGSAASGTNNPLNFPLTNAQPTVTAVFQPLSAGQFALAAVVDGFGTATNNPRGNHFPSSASVVLTATPEAGQEFLGWSGDASGTRNPITVLMNQSRVITAQFTKRPYLSFPPCVNPAQDEQLAVWLTGEWAAKFEIQTAPEVAGSWTPLLTLTNHFGRTQFLAPAATNDVRRFYRVLPD